MSHEFIADVDAEVRPKWDFSKALKVFNSEFKAKRIKFHYAMDVSIDEMKIDHVIADINRMKQGRQSYNHDQTGTDCCSSSKPHN